MQREWRFYLEDMIAFAEQVILETDIPALLPQLRLLRDAPR